MNTPSMQDPKFEAVLMDVIVRFHEHDQFKSEQVAMKTISRRYPGLTPLDYQAAFDRYSRIHKATVLAVIEYVRTEFYKPIGKMASPDDIDGHAIERRLREQFPEESLTALQAFIPWAIFWHYLK